MATTIKVCIWHVTDKRVIVMAYNTVEKICTSQNACMYVHILLHFDTLKKISDMSHEFENSGFGTNIRKYSGILVVLNYYHFVMPF